MVKIKTVIIGKFIEIKSPLRRHAIVRKVVNSFIQEEYPKKGRGIAFKYPVEKLPNGETLLIARPGHKKNFDFKVDVVDSFKMGSGSHLEIAEDLLKKNLENQKKFKDLLSALSEVYHCSENNADKVISRYKLKGAFKSGSDPETLIKVLKWLFVMEDIVYWDNEGRAFLFNFLLFASRKPDGELSEEIEKIKKRPAYLKTAINKAGLEWISCKG